LKIPFEARRDYNDKARAIRIGWQEVSLKQPVWKAILTDWHLWLPVAVLVIGIGLLAAVR
jgi:hypothetical protein